MSSEQEEYEAALVELQEAISDYARLDDEYQQVGADREQLRGRISELVALTGNQELPGFGRVEITSPSHMVSFDAKALDQLILELEAAGNPLAERIREARRESQRAGSLRISRER